MSNLTTKPCESNKIDLEDGLLKYLQISARKTEQLKVALDGLNQIKIMYENKNMPECGMGAYIQNLLDIINEIPTPDLMFNFNPDSDKIIK